MHTVSFFLFEQEILCKILLLWKTSDLWIIDCILIEHRPHGIADFFQVRTRMFLYKLLHSFRAFCRII